jgi:short-subunit dehydrogenase
MSTPFAKPLAVVTGASSGIGLELAWLCAEAGYDLVIAAPGATDTDFFARAGMTETKVGTGEKADPAEVAQAGFDAMEKGESDVVAGWKNKVQALLSNLTPADVLARQHRKLAEPGTGKP